MKYLISKNWHYILIAALVSWSSLSFAYNHSNAASSHLTAIVECAEISESNLTSSDLSHCTSSVSAVFPPQRASQEFNAVSPNDDSDDLYQFHLYLREKKPPRIPLTPNQQVNPA
ncbi:MAG: hypothetical protein K6L74_04670 [Neptuniibacter sp.]